MKSQQLIISFSYDSQLIKPLKVLVSELQSALDKLGKAYTVKDMISLDYKSVMIEIDCVSCEESFESIKPVLTASDIKARGKITLKYDSKKFIDVLFVLGADHKKMDTETIEIGAEFFKEHLPEKHGFLLVAYSKNGKDIEIRTENGVPESTELIEMYGILASNIMG